MTQLAVAATSQNKVCRTVLSDLIGCSHGKLGLLLCCCINSMSVALLYELNLLTVILLLVMYSTACVYNVTD